MRSGAAAGTSGYFHETALYGSDDELLAIVGPFLQDGLDAGEPTVVTFAEHNARLIRDTFGPDGGLRFLPGADQYARPATAIATYQELFGGLVAEGADQIRVVGDVPHPGTGADWSIWARYEAVVNTAYDGFPIWGLCPYDTRSAPDEVIADVLASHPNVATADGGHRHNPHFVGVDALTELRPAPQPDPLQATAPMRSMVGPTAAEARAAVAQAAAVAGLGEGDREDLALVASELVSNAHVHGTAPVLVEVWAAAGRVVLAVTDGGPGPGDPYAGLLRPEGGPGGFGLWLSSQLATDLVLEVTPHGFTARVGMGRG